MLPKERYVGETYRPMARVLQVKDGVPTEIKISGVIYVLVNDYYTKGDRDKGEES